MWSFELIELYFTPLPYMPSWLSILSLVSNYRQWCPKQYINVCFNLNHLPENISECIVQNNLNKIIPIHIKLPTF